MYIEKKRDELQRYILQMSEKKSLQEIEGIVIIIILYTVISLKIRHHSLFWGQVIFTTKF